MLPSSRYDVAVIGAGPAGVAAASAAAQHGVRVLLVEAADRLGGSVTAAMHRCLCGLYARAPESPLDTLNAGTQRAIVRRMMGSDPRAVVARRFGDAWVLEFPTCAWEAALADTCAEAGVELRLGARVTGVRRDGRRLTALQCDGWADAVEPAVVVDCTGGGKVLQLAGDDTLLSAEPPERRMLGGFAVRFEGLSGDPELLRLQTPYVLAKEAEQGRLPLSARFTMFYPGPGDGQGVCKLAVDTDDASAAEAGSLADRVVEHLMREVPGFAGARVVEKSPRALPRLGRRLRGRFVVCEDDIAKARGHGEGAVHAWWPMERWDPVRGPTYAYPPPGQHYDVPDDALRSESIDNLLAAGTCVSATPGAAASIRAGGICLATGDAAGRLAASLCIN